ncbi:MAG: hypothetical protein VYE68_02035, partial [Acidobacteriota bacterium]|nr:hypothetical protein [Acidobacteriota bacterium]
MAQSNPSMNELAERYVKLVLAVGQHDTDYVDAYYGPAHWRTEAEASVRPLERIGEDADTLSQELATVTPEADELVGL